MDVAPNGTEVAVGDAAKSIHVYSLSAGDVLTLKQDIEALAPVEDLKWVLGLFFIFKKYAFPSVLTAEL